MELSELARERKYRWKPWAIAVNLIPACVFVPAVVLIVAELILLLSAIFENGSVGIWRYTLLGVFGPLIVFFTCAGLWFVFFPLGQILFSYLKVTPAGLDYRYWPSYRIKCTWPEVERIGSHRTLGLIPQDVLFLRDAKPIGWPNVMAVRQRLGFKTKYMIALTGISGWPDGNLAAQLRHYVPKLFSNSQGSGDLETADPGSDQASGKE